MEKQPEGFRAFAKLLKRVISVPKEKVDAKIAQKRADSTNNPPKK